MNPLFSLKKLIWNDDDTVLSTYLFCQKLDIPVTKTILKKNLEEHPDFPSLLAVSDVLGALDVKNTSLRTDLDNFKDLPLPLIARVRTDNRILFLVVSNVDDKNISYTDPERKGEITSSVEKFAAIYSGIVLVAEKMESSGDNEYVSHRLEEKRAYVFKMLTILAAPVLFLVADIFCLFIYGLEAFPAAIFTLLSLLGTMTGALLLWYEVDKHNPILRQICTGGKKTNCSAILDSRASKIFGISWSSIGFTYFAGMLVSLLVAGIYNLPVLGILAWINVLALPYIAFSLYYQAKIAKQWCVLCLTVQAVLAAQFITSLAGGFHSIDNLRSISFSDVMSIAVSFALPFLTVNILLPALRSAKENRQNKNELQKLKHDPRIFEASLTKQNTITESAERLGIILGSKSPKYKLIKVCNPYCGPCAKAHPAIEDLMENNPDLQLQIIFTASNDEKDYRALPVKHLLAIAEKANEELMRRALDDWYLADKKDYDLFAIKYPMNGELQRQQEKINSMYNWCQKTEIMFTPTFFLNGYQLPDQYSVNDLKYFLSI